MSRRSLPLLCPQVYTGSGMVTEPCTMCPTGWDHTTRRCTVEMGAEHLPDVDGAPDCPIQSRCRHQHQSDGLCPIRRKGLVCESALVVGGMSDEEAADCDYGFNAITVASPDDLALHDDGPMLGHS